MYRIKSSEGHYLNASGLTGPDIEYALKLCRELALIIVQKLNQNKELYTYSIEEVKDTE